MKLFVRSLVLVVMFFLAVSGARADSPVNASCAFVSQSLGYGMSDMTPQGDIASLQAFLAGIPTIYPEGLVTGYYGAKTQLAVGRWQIQQGIVVDEHSEGFGYVGPRTRAELTRSCTTAKEEGIVAGASASTGVLRTHKANYEQSEVVQVSFDVSGVSNQNVYDWVAIYKKGASLQTPYAWLYTSGKKSVPSGTGVTSGGTIRFSDTTFDVGTYEVRVLAAASYEPLISNVATFMVTAPVAESVDATTIYAGQTHDAFPAVARLKNGNLLMVFRAGKEHGTSEGKVMAQESKDEGKSWGAARVLYDDPNADDSPGSDLTVLKNGTVLLGVHSGNATTKTYSAFVLRSVDNGVTWSKGSVLKPYSFPYGRMIEKKDKSVLLLAYGYEAGGGALFRSTDDGRTWSLWSAVVPPDGTAYGKEGSTSYTETALYDVSTKVSVAVVRGNTYGNDYADNVLYSSRSKDGGKTWSKPKKLFEGASPDIIRLPTGELSLCVADRDASDGATGVRCHVSKNDGGSWGEGTMLYKDASGISDHGYPYSVVTKNKKVLTVYYKSTDGTDAGVQIAQGIYDASFLRDGSR